MQKITKTNIIYIIIFITLILIIYNFITKEENYLENNIEIGINKNIENQELKSNTDENINKIKVHITGAIKNEGIYEIEDGCRIADIIEKAGGLTSEADTLNINLAYRIEDGMKIHIPKTNENIVEDNTEQHITKGNSNSEDSKKTKENKQNTININTATQTELETLPGIGPSISSKIIEYRKQNGKFKNIEDIKNVSGIGENKFLKIKKYITV